jgi:hypothetical protein
VLIGWLFGFLFSKWILLKIFVPLLAKITQIFYPDTDIFDSPGGLTLYINLSGYLQDLLNYLFPISAGLNAPVLIINK